MSDEANAPCPFCGSAPQWLSERYRGTGASGMEAPFRALGCASAACPVRPRTKWRDTEEWRPQKGYRPVNHDAAALAEWNHRAPRDVPIEVAT